MDRAEEIIAEESERLAEFEKMPNIYKITELGKEDAFYENPKFLEYEYRCGYRCPTDKFISTFLFFVDAEGKRAIVPFLSVKLSAIKEDAEGEYQVDGSKATMRMWNKTSYRAFHPSVE